MSDDAIAYYTGMLDRREDIFLAMCWTVVESCWEPLTVESMAGRLGADPARIAERPWDAGFDVDEPVAHLAQVGPAVMVAEVNGFAGSNRGVLGRLSDAGRAHSAFWNVNRRSARPGRCTASRTPGWRSATTGSPPVVS